MSGDFLNCFNSKQSYREKWQEIVFSTAPLDRQKTIKAVKDFYNLNGEKEPDVIVCDSSRGAIWQLINRSEIDLCGDRSHLLHPTTLNYQIFDYESEIFKQNKNNSIDIDSEIHWHLVRSITSPIESVKALLFEQLCRQLENKIYYEFVSESQSPKKQQLLKKGLPIEEIASRIISNDKYYVGRSELFSIIKHNNYKFKKDPRVKYQRILQLHDRLTSCYEQVANHYDFFQQDRSNILCQVNAAVIDFKISRLNLPVINFKAWQVFKSLAENCYLIFPFENVCLVSDRPRKLCFDDDKLHAENETAIEFADGWFCEYFERGIKVTEQFDRVYLSEEEKIAANHNTPADELRKLADPELTKLRKSSYPRYPENKNILTAIASNPNTPPDLLLNLATDYPGKVLNNPAIPLVLLENPEFIKEFLNILYEYYYDWDWYEDKDGTYLCYEKLPDFFWEYVLKHYDDNIRAFIARVFKIETSFLEKFAADTSATVRCTIASHYDTPIFILQRLARDEDVRVRCIVAKNCQTSAEILERLARDEDVRVRCIVAGNKNVSELSLKILAIDKARKVRLEVAKNINHYQIILEQLARDKDLEVARIFYTKVAILELLARDEDREVRLELAKNYNIPMSILELLARDEDREVCRQVARNKNIYKAIFQQLATDEYLAVRRQVAIAIKDNSSGGILEQLAKDENAAVRSQVASNNNTSATILERLATDTNPEVRCQVAINSNTSPAILEQLATDTNPEVRRAIAVNKNTPRTILERLATDTNDEVRRAIARNRKTSFTVLKQFIIDKDPQVRCNVASNRNTPLELLELLASDENSEVSLEIARNSNTPVAILERLATDIDPNVLSELATNLNTPLEIKKQLQANGIIRDIYDPNDIPF